MKTKTRTYTIKKQDIDNAKAEYIGNLDASICKTCIIYQVFKRLQYEVIGVAYETVRIAGPKGKIVRAFLDDTGQTITHLDSTKWDYSLVGTKFKATFEAD